MDILILSLVQSIFWIAAGAQNLSLLNTAQSIPSLSNFTTYLSLFPSFLNTVEELTNITILAPSNDAFISKLASDEGLPSSNDLVQALFSYHVLNGTYPAFAQAPAFIPTGLNVGAYANVTGGQRVEILSTAGNATSLSGLLQSATLYDQITFSGGILYLLDHFLTLPPNMSTTALALNLTSAVGALSNLSLIDTVDNIKDFTFFVPNNAAFQEVGGNLGKLTSSNLTSTMEYHIVAGSVLYSADITNGSPIPTLEGKNLTTYIVGSNVYIDNAKIILPNVLTANGVIHVIDRVLNPSNTTLIPNTATTVQAFPYAISADDVPFTSGVSTPTSLIATGSITYAVSSASAAATGSVLASGSKPTSHAGAIAGGVVGGVLLVALGLFLFWFLRRRRAGKTSQDKSAPSYSSGHDGAAGAVGRKETTKSYHKPELEATTKSYQKPELEAGTVPMTESRHNPITAPVAHEVDASISRVRTELSGESTAAQGTTGTPVSPTTMRREISTQEEQRRLHEQEEEEARLAEIAHQRRTAELEYQKRMAELEHEQRMAELDITAARLRSRNRTVSELEARADPGPGSGD